MPPSYVIKKRIMSKPNVEEHSSPIKTPGQLITVVVLGFLVPIILIVLIVHLVIGGKHMDMASPAMSDEEIAKRIKPVAQLAIVDANAPKITKTGEEVVKGVCAACHTAGLLNAPKIGDKAAWGKLAREGLPSLLRTALKGKGNMPPRGNAPEEISDYEITRAIVYMANQSGAKLKEPPPPAVKQPPQKVAGVKK